MPYDGSITFDTKVNTSGFSKGADKLNTSFDAIASGAENAAKGIGATSDSTSRLADIVKGSGAFKLIEKGLGAVVSSLDSAIDRYDTMNRFPMMLQQMGYGADEADAAVQRLSDGVQGLPTTLDSVVSTAQRLTVLTGNLDQSVDLTLALNDAFLASGSSSEGASRGLEQYVQALSRGKFEAEEWKTLQETMGLALTQVAESFGYAGESAQSDLYTALQNGEITFTQFNSKLLQLDEGVDGFAELAKVSSIGIKTSWTNLSTAIVRGTATIIGAIDSGLSKTRFKSIQNMIETTGDIIEGAMELAAPAIELVASNADTLAISIGALTVAYGANKAVQAFTTAQKNASAAMLTANAAGKLITPTLDAKTVAEARAAAVAKLGTAATEKQIVTEMAANGVITAKTFALGGMTTGMGAATVASGLLTAATTALHTAINVLLGPVGLVVLGLTALGAGAVALVKWITADSEAYEEQSVILEDLAEQQEQLASSEESNAKTLKKNIQSVRASADAAKDLTSQLEELSGVENKTASQKQRMGELVDQLNEKYADLCLTYDEEADLLSMNTEQLQSYIAAQQTVEEAAALQERYNQLLEEESMIRQSNAELDAKEQELNDQLAQKLIDTGEYNKLLEQLNETRASYITQEEQIAQKKAEIDTQIAALDTATAQTVINNAAAQQEAAQAAAEAEEAEMQRRTDALQTYTDAATNMFDRINAESELSVSEMISNLEYNQEAVSAWADNLVALGERGLDQGLLQQLRDAGPESAATVAELVNASDEQISQLSDVFRNGGEVATQALRKELGLPEVVNSGSDMVDDVAEGVATNESLTEATTQLIQDTKQAATSAVSSADFPGVGTQIINGITRGVQAGTSGLVNAMRSAVQSAVNAAKSEAQIHSPSILFRKIIGLNIMKGWALGVEDGEPLVSDAAVSAMDTLRQKIAGLNPSVLVASMRDTVAGLQSSIVGQLRNVSAAAWSRPAAIAGSNVSNYTQNIYFEQPMQAPDEIARALRIEQTYGLAGAR